MSTGKFFLEPDFFRTGAMIFFRTGAQHFFSEPETVINMAKMRATENLYTVPGSKFLEYARGTHHFVRSLQQIGVFYEKLFFD